MGVGGRKDEPPPPVANQVLDPSDKRSICVYMCVSNCVTKFHPPLEVLPICYCLYLVSISHNHFAMHDTFIYFSLF